VWIKYINLLYWSYATSGGGSYGDLIGYTPLEKCFEVLCIIFFKIYAAFIAAEITNIFSNRYTTFWNYFEKVSLLEEWA